MSAIDPRERDLVKCEDTRQRAPEIPWPLITGMRNVLAHDYGTVVLDKVHEVVTDHLPALLVRLAPLIESLEHDVGWQADDGADSSP